MADQSMHNLPKNGQYNFDRFQDGDIDNTVGLILYASNNYGSCATNIALYKVIENLGYTPTILDNLVAPQGVSADYLRRKCRMASDIFLVSPEEDLVFSDINAKFGSFVVGSDWSFNIRSSLTRDHIEYFLMAFVDSKRRKIAYSPSMGLPDLANDPYLSQLYKNLFSRFQFLSLREQSSIELCERELGVSPINVVDPVFLIGKDVYEEMARDSSLDLTSEPFLLAYILDPTIEKLELVKAAAKERNLDYRIIVDIAQYDKARKLLPASEPVLERPSFPDWLACFLECKAVVTDSFHGLCFSLIFHKDYIAIKNRTFERFETIAHLLEHRENEELVQIFTTPPLLQKPLLKSLDFNNFDKLLKKHGEASLRFLDSALCMDVDDISAQENLNQNLLFARLWSRYTKSTREYSKLKRQYKELKNQNKKLNALNKRLSQRTLSGIARRILNTSIISPVMNFLLPMGSQRRRFAKATAKKSLKLTAHLLLGKGAKK